MKEWINVKDVLPEEYTTVLVTDGADVWPDVIALGEWTTDPEANVTHWMRMPEPPGETKEETLFAIYDVRAEDRDGELKIEIAKDLDEKKAVTSFIALLAALASNTEMLRCFSKAVRIFTANERELFKDKERPLS